MPIRGIVLSLERMARVLEVDADNQMAVTEAGVRLSDFAKTVEESGLYFPLSGRRRRHDGRPGGH